jgi:putative hemolysin
MALKLLLFWEWQVRHGLKLKYQDLIWTHSIPERSHFGTASTHMVDEIVEELSEAEQAPLAYPETMNRVLGPDVLNTLASMKRLATIYLSWGRHAGAEEVYQHSTLVYTTIFGLEHPSTLGSRRLAASVYSGQMR